MSLLKFIMSFINLSNSGQWISMQIDSFFLCLKKCSLKPHASFAKWFDILLTNFKVFFEMHSFILVTRYEMWTGRLNLTLTGHIEQALPSTKNAHRCSLLVMTNKLNAETLSRTRWSDSIYRVWDIHSKKQVHALSGHENTVCSVFTRPTGPQVVITGSDDKVLGPYIW
ncbi:protein pleiotropic regulatory locus 1-like [Rhododendron vialii]|uniref:protein pleiotropic regulatory locus 1-like n=1 Tax=Rhododendron vialii TaxID=182163 RepID=UPI00265F16B9|nr:protein pleiotropic regulatory locus 1-like [Rhododendron vialii]